VLFHAAKLRGLGPVLLIIAALTSTSSVSAQEAVSDAGDTPINNDITKPIHRLDFFLENTQSAGGATWTPKARYERPFDLYDGWRVSARVEFTAVAHGIDTSTSCDASHSGWRRMATGQPSRPDM
jgi:hypothetical protein